MKQTTHLVVALIALATSFVAFQSAFAADRKSKEKRADGIVRYPLDRSCYLVGEVIPLGFSTTEKITLTLEPTSATRKSVQIYQGAAQPIQLDTSRLEPGTYKVLVNSRSEERTLTLVNPYRESAAAMVNEQVWPVRKEHIPQLRKSGVNAIFVMGNGKSYSRRNTLTDDLLSVQTSLFLNPSTRPTSFEPPRVWDWEMNNYLMRLSLISQSQLRYPAFGGICFEWDPGKVIRRPSIFFRYGKMTADYHVYQQRSNEAVEKQFQQATGLTPATTKEFLQYVLAIGHPEHGPAIDLPTMRWLEKIAKHVKPIPRDKLADLEKRVVAWHKHLMQVYGNGHKFYQSQLDRIDASLAHTASVNLDHGAISTGQYAPEGYQHLDFRHMSAWNDQIGIGDYDFQWLLSAALMNAGNSRNQPIWVAGATGVAHGMPGKCIRAAAHNLAQNGTGIGSAAEGGYSWLSKYEKGKQHQAAIDGAREFLQRFSSLATHAQGEHQVAILYSKTDFAHRIVHESLGSPAWQAVVTLTRLGYTPRFITEAEIKQGKLNSFRVLTIWNQTFELPREVRQAISRFIQQGGRVIADGSTTIALPGMEKMKQSIYKIEARGVYGWAGPSQLMKPRGMAQISEFLYHHLAPGVLKALGNETRAWYHQARGARSDITLSQINPGPDARYILAINDSWYSGHWSHTRWHQVKEKLIPGKHIHEKAVLYDLNEEKRIGSARKPFTCDLTQVTARVLAVLKRPIKTIDLRAKQSLTAGTSLDINASFLDEGGQPVHAVLPLHLTIQRPDRSLAFQGYRSSDSNGHFLFSYPVGSNALPGQWTVRLRCQLNGEKVSLPIQVQPGRERVHAQQIKTTVIARQTRAIQQLLKKDVELVIPIISSEHSQQHLRAAVKAQQSLNKLGVKVRIWRDPEMSKYVLTYVPTKQQLAGNQRVDQAKAIGEIARLTHRGEDYYTDMGGYRCRAHLLLFDLAGTRGDNPLAERLEDKGILWPEVSGSFPGEGKAVVQLIHHAFDPKKSTIVIQARDAQGLVEGAKALVDLPEDWIGTSVSRARRTMLRQWHVHGGPDKPQQKQRGELTAKDRQVKHDPRPFRLNLAGIKVPTQSEEPAAPTQFKREYLNLPITTEEVAKQSVAQQRIRGGFTDAFAGHNKSGNSDLRFSDATVIPVNVKEANNYQMVVKGIFRYSDRMPRSQGSWEEILRIYKEVLPRKREPMEWEVQVDGKTVGKLKPCETGMRDVPVETLPFYMKKPPPSVRETVVTKLCGTIRVPRGKHEIRLIYRNMVDGQFVGFSIEPSKK